MESTIYSWQKTGCRSCGSLLVSRFGKLKGTIRICLGEMFIICIGDRGATSPLMFRQAKRDGILVALRCDRVRTRHRGKL